MNRIIYQSQNNENISLEVLYDDEDFSLMQKSMSRLFNIEVNTINYHLKEIFESHELEENRTIRKIRKVQNVGVLYKITLQHFFVNFTYKYFWYVKIIERYYNKVK